MCPHGRLDVAVVQGFVPGMELPVPFLGWDIILYRQGAGGCGLHSRKGCDVLQYSTAAGSLKCRRRASLLVVTNASLRSLVRFRLLEQVFGASDLSLRCRSWARRGMEVDRACRLTGLACRWAQVETMLDRR